MKTIEELRDTINDLLSRIDGSITNFSTSKKSKKESLNKLKKQRDILNEALDELEEYRSNPPLTVEELKESFHRYIPIWDIKTKRWYLYDGMLGNKISLIESFHDRLVTQF